jgi:hypothetical protein
MVPLRSGTTLSFRLGTVESEILKPRFVENRQTPEWQSHSATNAETNAALA